MDEIETFPDLCREKGRGNKFSLKVEIMNFNVILFSFKGRTIRTVGLGLGLNMKRKSS